MRPAARTRSGPCVRKPRSIRLHLSVRYDRALQMDAPESFIKMTLDEDKRLRRLNGSLVPSEKKEPSDESSTGRRTHRPGISEWAGTGDQFWTETNVSGACLLRVALVQP